MLWESGGSSPPAFGRMSWINGPLALKGIALLLLGIAAVTDYRTRTASNWVTLPLFFGSLIFFPFMPLDLGTRILSVFLSLLFFWLWKVDGMGGADAKVLIALTLAWLPAAMLSLVAVAFFGIFARLRNQKTLPGLVPVFLASTLTFALEVSIMFSN